MMVFKSLLGSCIQTAQSALEYHSFSILLTLCAVFLSVYLIFRRRKSYKLPPGPTGLPLVGYLPFLSSEPFRDLDQLKRKYGGIFSIYMGRIYVVILGDFEIVKEAFSKPTTTDRPSKLFDFLPDGTGFSSVNGNEWVQQRRYCVRAMRDLGLGRTAWETLVQEEVDDVIKIVKEQNGKPVNITKWLTSSVSNNVSSLLFGRRMAVDDPRRQILDQSVNVVSQFFKQTGIRNFFPLVCDVLVKLGISEYARLHKKMVDFNSYVRKEVERRKNDSSIGCRETFIDGYLQEMKKRENDVKNTFNDRNLYGNLQAIFIGGSDTTRTSINWLLLVMAKFSNIQRKVQEEIDRVLGKDGKITWSERTSLPYTFAVIMEGQRWKTIAPLNTSRIAMEDIKIGGYDIPNGTTIIANNWGLHNDPKYWKDPDNFEPERFLLNDGKQVNFKSESYVPFSY
ncbi:cytochrome P450 2J6-like, partial [Stegodyphus dumicola]|uniref:cytochrome P450 2J6-like n=1 Tax=Stegodyphus dumicola TaxID=202533 RepID=UPI0015B1BB88